MKKSIQLFTVLFISFFFLISTSDLNATTISFYTDDYESSLEDKKKNKKKSNDVKTRVKEKEIPPANEDSSSPKNDEAYNYMSSPKLEDCTKADFDRE